MPPNKTHNLQLKFVGPIPEIDPNYTLVSCSVSNSGDGLFLYIMDDPNDDVHGRIVRGASFAKTKMPAGKTFKLIIKSENKHREILIDKINFTYPTFDVFNDGRVVIAGGRTQWRSKDDYDLNGLIFDPSSGERIRFLAGDGIENLSVDDKSRLFISYFDEGIFGNNGWNHPGPAGPGAGGLCCFNAKGELNWQFNSVDGSGEFISDCFAMNVSGEHTYIYYYTDFSLCEIGPEFETAFWRPNLSGCNNFAIDENVIVFSGQYHDPSTRFYLLKRLLNHLSKPVPLSVNLEFGQLIWSNKTICRGAHIHHFNEDGWFRSSISSLAKF